MRALIVDDSRAMRALLRQILTANGFDVLEAGNGQEGLDRLASMLEKPDLALVDWHMPIMDGLTFVRTLRADPANAATRVLMVTTETELGQMASALAAGANEYVLKPFTREVIREKLALIGLTPAAA